MKNIFALAFLINFASFSILFSQDSPSFPRYEAANPPPHEALFYESLPRNSVRCNMCPWACALADGARGICGTRVNKNGKLITLTYARPCTTAIDPIEKKPFFHFLPGSEAFSLAAAGCNLDCKFCQNWEISKALPEDLQSLFIPPEGIISLVKKAKCRVIALTYSEPITFYEYTLDIAKLARKNGIKTAVVSGGYINPEPLKMLCRHVDAIKIDLKGFSEEFYKKYVGGRLKPVLDTIKTIKQQNVHLEIVNLVIPGLNDNPDEVRKMCRWIKMNAGPDVPFHFSRFHPDYKMREYPPTPQATLEKLYKIARSEGLHYVYIGNIEPGSPAENTICPQCRKTIIKRSGYAILENNTRSGKCGFCGRKIYGVFE